MITESVGVVHIRHRDNYEGQAERARIELNFVKKELALIEKELEIRKKELDIFKQFAKLEQGNKQGISDFISDKEAAKLLGLKTGTLQAWRNNKKQKLPYYKTGRLVKYKLKDINDYIESRKN